MLNKSALSHPAMQCKLLGAMIRAKSWSRDSILAEATVILRNRNKKPLLIVKHVRSFPSHFSFHLVTRVNSFNHPLMTKDITETVLDSLRS